MNLQPGDKNLDEPALFFDKDDVTNVKFNIINVNKLKTKEKLTSPKHSVQSMSFAITIMREKTKKKMF